jgi:hypothetical protein
MQTTIETLGFRGAKSRRMSRAPGLASGFLERASGFLLVRSIIFPTLTSRVSIGYF